METLQSRLCKGANQKPGGTQPEEAHEEIFPSGVPVTMHEAKPEEKHGTGPSAMPAGAAPRADSDAVSTKAEAGLQSEAGVIKEQAREAQPLQEAENLLPATPETPARGRKK